MRVPANARELSDGYRAALAAGDDALRAYLGEAFHLVIVEGSKAKIAARRSKSTAGALAALEEQIGIWDAFARKTDGAVRSASDVLQAAGGGYADLLRLLDAKRAAIVRRS